MQLRNPGSEDCGATLSRHPATNDILVIFLDFVRLLAFKSLSFILICDLILNIYICSRLKKESEQALPDSKCQLTLVTTGTDSCHLSPGTDPVSAGATGEGPGATAAIDPAPVPWLKQNHCLAPASSTFRPQSMLRKHNKQTPGLVKAEVAGTVVQGWGFGLCCRPAWGPHAGPKKATCSEPGF